MKSFWKCEKCDETFDSQKECEDHETSCSTKETRWCYKCEKTQEWDANDTWAFAYHQSWHFINLGTAGYGSGLDGCEIKFMICDDCLMNIIDSFTLEGQEKIHNSGANAYLPPDIWIKLQKGELTDEEYEQYGMYSPTTIRLYEERFSTCNHPINKIYANGSKGCGCVFGTFGDYGQKPGTNISEKCAKCQHYVERYEPIKEMTSDEFSLYERYYIGKMNYLNLKEKFE